MGGEGIQDPAACRDDFLADAVARDRGDAENLGQLHRQFYDNNSSFVICEANPEIEKQFEEADILDYLNITPTESEAWDIVQMEEIERDLLSE